MPIQSCRDILVAQNLSIMNSNRTARLLISRLISSEFYSRLSAGARASVPDLFSGDYDQFHEVAEKERNEASLDFSEEEAQSGLTLIGLPGATQAWRDCMLNSAGGLFCELQGNPKGVLFTLTVNWKPPQGLGAEPLENVEAGINSTGIAKYDRNFPRVLSEGHMSRDIIRDSASAEVHGYINGRCGTANWSTSFIILPYIQPQGLAEDPYYLTDHFNELFIEAANIHGGLQLNKVYWQPTVIIGGIRYYRALGMHAPANTGWAQFRIPQGAKRFHSIFGMAEQNGQAPSTGDAKGSVKVDDRVVWSQRISGNGVTQTGNINVENARTLQLEVDGLGEIGWDHTTWANPYFSAT